MRKQILKFFFGFLTSFFFVAYASAATNTMTITEADGVTKINYPVQIGRPFEQGEIVDYPQVIIDGIPVVTQANVKIRWPDGSVKHAVLNFLIPNLNALQSVAISFQNQESGNNTALTKAEMLAENFDFDAQILPDFGSGPLTISARTMLSEDNFSNWLSGSVATSVTLADHSITRSYDFGADANKSLRPIVNATFWPGINKVLVRFIVENSSTEVLQDQNYAVELKTGNSSLTTQYSKNTFTHTGGSRWTKEYWIGGDPGNVSINHNLAYLEQTGAIFNYDANKIIPENIISSNYTSWSSASKNIYDSGSLTKYMPTTGGRPEIGPYPKWIVAWLYSGDNRMKQWALGNADLAAAWPMHFREGDPTKHMDRNNAVPGLGKIMSISNRPTLALVAGYSYTYTLSNDRIQMVGTVSNGGWTPDSAHMPDLYSVPYLLTGDFWYLEQGLFWASWAAAHSNGAAYNYSYGRGPTGAEGGLAGQLRGQAWTLRNRVNLAWLVPDDMSEKDLLEVWINDAIAIEEGYLNITTGPNYQNTLWNWGRNVKAGGEVLSPLHQYGPGGTEFSQAEYGIDTAVTKEALSLFEQNYMTIALGRAFQAGYDCSRILNWVSQFYIGALTDISYNPYLLENGRVPTKRMVDSQYFDSWSDLKTGYDSANQQRSNFSLANVDGYEFISAAAVSMAGSTQLPQALNAWNFVEQNILTAPMLNNDPKWALVPFAENNDALAPAAPSGLTVN